MQNSIAPCRRFKDTSIEGHRFRCSTFWRWPSRFTPSPPLPLVNHLPDPRHKLRSHRRRPSEFFVQVIPAFRATGDMLFDSEHFGLGEFLQSVALHLDDSQVGNGFTISGFQAVRARAAVISSTGPDRLRMWPQSNASRHPPARPPAPGTAAAVQCPAAPFPCLTIPANRPG